MGSSDERQLALPTKDASANQSSVPSSRASIDGKTTPAIEKDESSELYESSEANATEANASEANATEANATQANASSLPTTQEKKSTESNPRPVAEHVTGDKDGPSVEEKNGPVDTSTHGDAKGTESEVEDESKYLDGLPLLVLIVALCLTTFLIGLDQMIIATAIPKITTQFHSLSDVGWYGSAYLLTTTSLQPSFGKVYTYFNVKYTFVSAMAVFELGSIVCAVSKSSPVFIVGRAIAGTGAAGLFSGGMTIVGYSVPLRKRAMYIAALSSMFGISSIVGPILGGVFTDKISWRWCFWINLPFGGAAIAVVLFFFRSPERHFAHISFKQKVKEMDLPGAMFLISAIVCLLLALQWGGITKLWKDSEVWGCFIGFVLLISIFIGIQVYKKEHATIPPRVIGQRSIIAAALTLALLSMGIYTHIYYLPFYFQAVKGTTAEQSGIRCIAYLISNTISSLINGALVTIVGYYSPFIWLGTAVFTVGSGMLHILKVDSPNSTWIGYQILAGYGSGAAVQLPFIAVQVVLSPKDMPTGNAVAMFSNSLGGAIAISIAQNIFSNTLVKEITKHVPGVDAHQVVNAGATNIQYLFPEELLPTVIEAFNKAVTTAFILPIAVGGLAFCSSMLFEWKSVKGKNLLAAAGGA